MKRAVSFFRSHFGPTGMETVQIFPFRPAEKNVVSNSISVEPHPKQYELGGVRNRVSNRFLMTEWRSREIILPPYS
jgi:hypothetical protein